MKKIEILLCDARLSEISLTKHIINCEVTDNLTVGKALVALNIANSAEDPSIQRKGCFGVFGKRKEWDSPLYDQDRLELYSKLLIDPMEARRKKANKNKDARLKAKAAGRKGRFLSKS